MTFKEMHSILISHSCKFSCDIVNLEQGDASIFYENLPIMFLSIAKKKNRSYLYSSFAFNGVIEDIKKDKFLKCLDDTILTIKAYKIKNRKNDISMDFENP